MQWDSHLRDVCAAPEAGYELLQLLQVLLVLLVLLLLLLSRHRSKSFLFCRVFSLPLQTTDDERKKGLLFPRRPNGD